jgi:hypothetical protein
LLFATCCFQSHAAIITVPGDYPTIQGAINAASDSDEIIVSPGTYYENINFGGKNIILRSTDPTNPAVVSSTIIDGNHAGSVVTFSGSESSDCVLSGFTIMNGNAPNGGGIYGNGTLAAMRDNNITSNTASVLGGGVYDCDGLIENNIVCGNLTDNHGGGLYGCDGVVISNNISNNLAGTG